MAGQPQTRYIASNHFPQVLSGAAVQPKPEDYEYELDEVLGAVVGIRSLVPADALLGGAIKFEGEMLDPPMFGKALQTLLKAHALHALSEADTAFAIEVLRKLPEQVVRENWPYGVIL